MGGATSMFDHILAITDGKTAEENPGYRLVLNSTHLDALAEESPGAKSPREVWPVANQTVLGYPIRLDESVTEMRLEPA